MKIERSSQGENQMKFEGVSLSASEYRIMAEAVEEFLANLANLGFYDEYPECNDEDLT